MYIDYLDFMQAGNTGTMGGWYLLSSDIYDGQFSPVMILMKKDMIRMIMNNNEIMRFPPAQRGDVISYPFIFSLLVSSFWNHIFGSVLGIRYHFCTYFSFYLDKQHFEFSSVRCFFFQPKKFCICSAVPKIAS